MADNTVLNLGAGGDTIATDDISGVKHQRVKMEFGADGSATDVSAAAPLPARLIGRGATVGSEGSVSFSNSDAANTVKVASTIAMPSELPGESIGAVCVENPSTESDLTCRVYVQETINSVVRWALVANFNVPKSVDAYNPDQTNKISVGRALIQGVFTGENISIVLSNNTVLGASGAFTARIKIRSM